MPRNPSIIAHRGASYDAPENTLAAFELAWAQGADGIEGDFRLTRDGAIVCLHDATTRRVGDRELAVAASTLDELRTVDVGRRKGPKWAGTGIPTLDEILSALPPGKLFFLEIKCGVEILIALAHAFQRQPRVVEQTRIIAFDADVLAAAKRQFPAIPAYWLKGFGDSAKTGVPTPSAIDILTTLQRVGADGVDAQGNASIDGPFVEALRGQGKDCHVWVVDDPAEARRYIALGVDSITTNRPAWIAPPAGRRA